MIGDPVVSVVLIDLDGIADLFSCKALPGDKPADHSFDRMGQGSVCLAILDFKLVKCAS